MRADCPVEVGSRVLKVGQERYPSSAPHATHARTQHIIYMYIIYINDKVRERDHAPALERWQLAQLDPPKAVIAKGAQQRVLFKTSPKWLSVESADAPSQTRVPSTSCTAGAASRTGVPRDEQRTINQIDSIINQSIHPSNHPTHPKRKKIRSDRTTRKIIIKITSQRTAGHEKEEEEEEEEEGLSEYG